MRLAIRVVMENAAPKIQRPICADDARRALAARRVMIVSEDVENAGKVFLSLTRAGCQVRIVRRHTQVAPFLERSDPEMLIVDLDGLGGRGGAFVRELRMEARWAKAIIVGLTVRDSRSTRKRFLSAGYDEVLPKPVDAYLFALELVSALPALAV